MTFGAVGFLLAAAAAAIPVVLHLINRQKAKDLPFSTLRFLRICAQKTRRRKRIHDLLLMLIRVAVLVLIALGLAKPTLEKFIPLLGGGSSSAVAIVLDNSASMGMIDHGRPRFETALGSARQIMDRLKEGDQVALFLTGGPGFPEQGKLDRTHENVLQMLNQCRVSYERADVGVKVQQARKLLAEAEASNKQIFVLGDMQKLSWEGFEQEEQTPAPPAAEGDQQDEQDQQKGLDIPVVLVDCNRTPKPNVALQGVELDAVVPVTGLTITATAELLNTSSVPQQRHLELYVDGAKKQSSPALQIKPRERLKHQFQFHFERGGLHRGEVRLVGSDGSSLDDRRFFTMEVDQGIPVAIVKSRRHEIPYLDDAFYVDRALTPTRSGGWAITTTTLLADELAGEPLSNYTVIFCVNLPAPQAEAAGGLRRYVADGGNLVWICGDNVQPEAYNAMNQQAEGQLLPAELLGVRLPDARGDGDSWHIADLDKKHPALTHLLEPPDLYRSVLVYKHMRLDTKGASEVRVLAKLNDGEALLVQRSVQKGTVTMLATSAHIGWTNFPLRPLFLPLFAQLTFDMAGTEQARHTALAGSPLVLQFDQQIRPSVVEVIPPSGATIRKSTTQQAAGSGQQAAGSGQSFRYADTHDVGVYLLRLLEGVGPTQTAFSVNVDPEEADPTKIKREELEERFGETPLVFAEDPDDLSSTLDQEGKSLWELFLSCVLIALVLETFLSNRLSPKEEEDQLQHVPTGMRRLARKGRGAA